MAGPKPQTVGPPAGGVFHDALNLNYLTLNEGAGPLNIPVITDAGKPTFVYGRMKYIFRDITNGPTNDQISDHEKMMFLALHTQLERVWKYGAPEFVTQDDVVGNRISRPSMGINPNDFKLPGQ